MPIGPFAVPVRPFLVFGGSITGQTATLSPLCFGFDSSAEAPRGQRERRVGFNNGFELNNHALTSAVYCVHPEPRFKR